MGGVFQPSGSVTLVFTDIEGSTRLLHELGTQAYKEALAEHRRIVREACSRHAGYEVDYEGDAFFYAFSSAKDAVSAISEAMAGLEEGPIAIRVGIHTGEPELDPPKYVGMDVHKAARIMSCAHGGQVVLSPSTASLLDGSFELTDLGKHRFKDLSAPERIYQLGSGSFPPLKTISNTNLPRPASSFLGREVELREVLARIEGGARLVTLTGPGGTGKTRLGLEAAMTLVPAYKAGVFWVGLAPLRDHALVTETIAQVLGAKDALTSHIGDRQLLLLLDNLEQVIEAAPDLSELLTACPNLTLLVTSRELLRISGEVDYAVPPLAEPEAVSLFCARAQLDPSEEIAELCARLDSLPLAVELAAARTKALAPAQILERVAGRLDVLKGGRDADPRQQTLRATIEWSYELLSPREQQLFASLSVFAGGCTLEAAEKVADADLDTLQSLVEKSLLRFTASESGGRYWMLETICEYAGEQLRAVGNADPVRERHARHYLLFAEALEPSLLGVPNEGWLLLADIDNLRKAIAFFAEQPNARDEGRLTGSLFRLWEYAGLVAEGRRLSEHALQRLQPEAHPEFRLKVLYSATICAVRQGDWAGALEHDKERLALARELKDMAATAVALMDMGSSLGLSGDNDAATELLEESRDLAQAFGYMEITKAATDNLAWIALDRGDHTTAKAHAELARALSKGEAEHSFSTINLGLALLGLGKAGEAAAAFRQALPYARDLLGVVHVLQCLEGLASVALQEGDALRAARLTGATKQLRSASGCEPDRYERSHIAANERAGREALGPDTWALEQRAASTLSIDAAVSYALEHGLAERPNAYDLVGD